MSTEQAVTGMSVPVYEFDPGDVLPVMGNAARMDEYREKHSFFRSSAAQGFWVLTRSELIREALQDPATFSSSAVHHNEPNPAYLWVPQMLDPPRHTKWRRHLGPYFSPGNLNKLHESVRVRCIEHIDRLAGRGSIDFVEDFASQFPTAVFMDLFGLPGEELDQFLRWTHRILHLTPEQDPGRTDSLAAMNEVIGYFNDLIAQRRASPRDDILSDALDWRIDDEPIPHDELLSFCLLMFLAGLDTVTIQLTYTFWHLATHPEDRRRIVAEPEVIPLATEELLRLYSFVPPGRKVMHDVDFHGCPMKAGDMVFMDLSSACRDEEQFADGKRAILDRQPNPHMAFGLGPHRCAGATLARRELQVALEEWHKEIPDYRIPDGFEVVERGVMHGIESMRLEW